MILYENNRISVCREIAAKPSAVWDILTDTQLWPVWGPSVLNVDCNDRYITTGSSGRVKTLLSFWLPFTVTAFRRLEYWSWNIGPVAATGHRLIRKSETSCILCFDMAWWAAFYIPICWLALHKIDQIARSAEPPA